MSRCLQVFKLRVLQCIQISLLGNNRTGYNNNRATALTVCIALYLLTVVSLWQCTRTVRVNVYYLITDKLNEAECVRESNPKMSETF